MSLKQVGADEMVELAITLERPPATALRGLTRSEKYRALSDHSIKLRQGIIRWIGERGMSGEVARVGEPTAFNVLTMVATPRVADVLPAAPGVTHVGVAVPLPVDLPRPKRR
jgi:hypothetical protein